MSDVARSERIELGRGFGPNSVVADGTGQPVVYLHGLLGSEWPRYLQTLAQSRRVIAPTTPGVDQRIDLDLLDTVADLVLYYDDLFDALGLESFDLVGHSYGGMVACEYAGTFRHRVGKLVLIDPLGLWDDEEPVADHFFQTHEDRFDLFFDRQDAPDVRSIMVEPTDLAEAQARYIEEAESLAAAAHFTHPIPDKGLKKRISRVAAPTLLVWGENDRLVPASYAARFQTEIANSRVEMVPGVGHYPHLEDPDRVARLTREFLDD